MPDLPALSKYKARDGNELEYRYYPAKDSPDKPVFILLHGISTDGKYLHSLANRITQKGMAHVYVPNLRGYGEQPRRRGDIDYIGQLEDDLSDLIRFIHMDHPSMPIALGGHSAGGGTALRLLSGKYGSLIDACLLLSPALSTSSLIHKKGKATKLVSLSLPRLIGLMMLNKIGVETLNGLPVMIINKQGETLDRTETLSLSYRLLTSRMPPLRYESSMQALPGTSLVLVGERDEEFAAGSCFPLFPLHTDADVEVLPGLTHDGMLISEETFRRIEAWWNKLDWLT
ncbi:hypothetical protein BC351_15790 [Paenibacillus ferrarius]|uniref:Serine aminopeptidase S33 domain-containing protein n=1 Tax=Paenibacillus ferrarius TaxID=1469647 RepID=A0A1V4HS62_9BACL|nr:hypothetical protein BC351_15790 [Paenibacillus ferrarius]